MIREISEALSSDAAPPRVRRGEATLPSVYDVSGLASASIGCAAAEVAQLSSMHGGDTGLVVVDQVLASKWFGLTATPVDFELAPTWDSVAGDYRCADGWIRLHTNARHHREAAMRVLGTPTERGRVAAEVATWNGESLETAIVEQGGCAAQMRRVEEWSTHDQGREVGSEPLIAWSGDSAPWVATSPAQPLKGLKVLDLTRVLAGPACTRFLAGWGADVLRIDPVDWEEPSLAPEVTLGKRCARLDIRAEREIFDDLVETTDVVVHGYRPGALEGLGVGPFDGKVDVALDAYGWRGPWASRRGFDSLVQMSTGIAAQAMAAYGTDKPWPLPVQALDHATGYLMAAAVVRALQGGPSCARLSLARTAALLVSHAGTTDADFDFETKSTNEATAWGNIRRTEPPVQIGAMKMRWDRPACPLGTHPASWTP